MTNEEKTYSYKYNLSFYYQSTIVYFIVFVLYIIIRGEFVEGSFTVFTQDPLIYFFAVILIVSIISLVYNVYRNKHITIKDNGIAFVTRVKERLIILNDMENITISKVRGPFKNKVLRIVRIKIKGKRKRLVIRLFDYENENELLAKFQELSERQTG